MMLQIAVLGLLCASLAAGAGQPGKDFKYYTLNATDFEYDIGHGVTVSGWNGSTTTTTDPVAFGPTTINRIVIPSGGKFPNDGSTFYLPNGMWYFVLEGNATYGDSVDSGATFDVGDLLRVEAGFSHGPITNVGCGEGRLVVYVLGAPFAPAQSLLNRTNPTVGLTQWSVAWHLRSSTTGNRFMTVGHGDGASPTAKSDVKDYPVCDIVDWGAVGEDCPWTDRKADGCHLDPHYHPYGAYYIAIEGAPSYAGDYDEPVYMGPGEVRYTRPGHYYGPEYCPHDRCLFYAFHPGVDGVSGFEQVSDVSFDRPPPGPFLCQYNITLAHVFDEEE